MQENAKYFENPIDQQTNRPTDKQTNRQTDKQTNNQKSLLFDYVL